MATLYDITGRAVELLELAEEEELDEEVLKDTLESIEGEFDVKIESYCKVCKNLDADIDAIKAEIERLETKLKYKKNNRDRIKAVMFSAMRVLGKNAAGGLVLNAKIKKNGGKAPLIVDEKEAKNLPFEFQKVTVEADTAAIRDALEHGRELSFAHIGERGEHLEIK